MLPSNKLTCCSLLSFQGISITHISVLQATSAQPSPPSWPLRSSLHQHWRLSPCRAAWCSPLWQPSSARLARPTMRPPMLPWRPGRLGRLQRGVQHLQYSGAPGLQVGAFWEVWGIRIWEAGEGESMCVCVCPCRARARVRVRVRVHAHVCVRVRMFVRACVCLCACICVCMRGSAHAHVCVCARTWMLRCREASCGLLPLIRCMPGQISFPG